MSQKLQAMQHGLRQLRETDQACQSIIDSGSASNDTDASQNSQKGWHLAKKCSAWANEVQVSCSLQSHVAAAQKLAACAIQPAG